MQGHDEMGRHEVSVWTHHIGIDISQEMSTGDREDSNRKVSCSETGMLPIIMMTDRPNKAKSDLLSKC